MIKEHKVFFVHADQHMGGKAATEVAAQKLNELSVKGWQCISVSTGGANGTTLLLCVARNVSLNNLE